MKVIIAEKPNQARDIAKVLGASTKKDGCIEGNGYIVTWARGHLLGLASPKAYGYERWSLEDLPMLPDNFKLAVNKSKAKQFKIVRGLLQNASEVICATDAGREGELIFRYIYSAAKVNVPFKRLWISSLTESAIKEGFRNLKPGDAYDNLYYSAKARSEADWLIGMNATRALTLSTKSTSPKSVGRVQTPVLGFVVNRYEENMNFVPETYFTVSAALDNNTIPQHETKFKTRKEATELAQEIEGKQAVCSDKEVKQLKEESPLPFDLPSLQREANKKFGLFAQQTLDITQELYEKHKVVTYPRTDSRYLSDDMLQGMDDLIEKAMGICEISNAQELNPKGNKVFNNNKVTDHHAIIPTGTAPNGLSQDQENIFFLISLQFCATFFPDCLKTATKYVFSISEKEFIAKGTVINVQGWREILGHSNNKDQATLPDLEKGSVSLVKKGNVEEKQTRTKPLHTDSSLVEAMKLAGTQLDEKEHQKILKGEGIGTAATRGSIIETLIKREYIVRQKKHLIPTETGSKVYQSLANIDISSPVLTAKWEQKLKDIESGELQYSRFMEALRKETERLTEDVLRAGQTINFSTVFFDCPTCNNPMQDRGKAYSCECGLVMWKSMADKKIPEAAFKALAEKGRTGLVKGFKSKEGKPFDAYLVLKDGKVEFDFNSPEKYNCPSCKEQMKNTPKGIFCDCGVMIWKTVAGKKLSEKALKELTEKGQTTKIKGFKSKKGKSFEASLKLEGNSVKFEF